MTTYYPQEGSALKRIDASTLGIFLPADQSGGSVRFAADGSANPVLSLWNNGDAVARAVLGSVVGNGALSLTTQAGTVNLLTAGQLGAIAPIGSLSPTANDVMQYKSGAWTNRTMAQLATDLTTLATVASPSFTGPALFTIGASDTVKVTVSGNGFASVQLGAAFGSGIISLGGGTVAPDVSFAHTGVGTFAVTGTATLPAPNITGHPTIEGVTSTGATGTGKFVFDTAPTFTTSATSPNFFQTDGTAGNGQIKTQTLAAGTQALGGYDNTADTLPNWVIGRISGLYGSVGVYFSAANGVSDVSFLRTGAAAALLTGQTTVATGLTFSSGIDITINATTGTKIGQSTSKIAFFGATPVVQQLAATDPIVALSNLGLRVAGTAWPLTTSGAVATGALAVTGAATVSTTLTVTGNVGFNGKTAQATTGWAAPTATLVRTALANPTYTTTGGTGATAGAFDTAAHRDNIITDLFTLTKTVAALVTDLRANGVIG